MLHFGVQGFVLVVEEDLYLLAVEFRHRVKGLCWVTTVVELIVGNCTRPECHSCQIDLLVVAVEALTGKGSNFGSAIAVLEVDFEFQTARIRELTDLDGTAFLVAGPVEVVAAVKSAVKPEVRHMDFALLAAAGSYLVSFVEYGSVRSFLAATEEIGRLNVHLKSFLAAVEETVRLRSLLAEFVETVVATVPNHLVASLVNTSAEIDSQLVAAAAFAVVQKGCMID